MRTLRIILMLLFFQNAVAQQFTIPVMPDTQVEVNQYNGMFLSRMQWVAKNKNRIPFVCHVGDLVNFNNNVHWDNASEGYDVLDDNNMKYAIAIGNHDCGAVGEFTGSAAPGDTHLNLRNTEKFNRYFPPYRFKGLRGSFEKNKSDNSFHTFKYGKANWMVVNIEFCPREEVIKWADSLVAAHPHYNVIVQTHYYLNPDGSIGQDNQGYGDMSPQQMYDAFIKKHKNIFLVISGHKCGTALREDTGINGNKIYSVLQDYQCEDAGGGYIRLLDFNMQKKTITGKMYSPFYNKTLNDKSAFQITNVNFIVEPQQ